MKPIDWLRYNQPGFAELSGDERDAIAEFVFLWSLFEARVLDCRASARAIVEATKHWSERGVLSQQTFQEEQAYFRNRYCPGGQFSPHYDNLNFRPPDKQGLVRKFLMQECQHAWEDATGLLIVVYRLRNNLFHGSKWAYAIRGQHENFGNANTSLVGALELENAVNDQL